MQPVHLFTMICYISMKLPVTQPKRNLVGQFVGVCFGRFIGWLTSSQCSLDARAAPTSLRYPRSRSPFQTSRIVQQIIATDGGQRSSSVELSVTITNLHNQPPQWEESEYWVTVPEDAVRDAKVLVSCGSH